MTKTLDRTKFLEDLNNAIDNFEDNNYSKVIAISHNDADGISSLHLVQNLLYKMGINYDYFIYNRSLSWATYLEGILSKKTSNKTAYIFTDVGSNLSELIPIINKREEHFYILDHHEVDSNFNNCKIPQNLNFVNPTVYGYDGLEHIAGSTLAYMFAKKIKPSLIKQGWLTIIGIAGDALTSMDKLQSFNREIYEEILDEEVFEDHEGLILYGSMYDTIKNALKYSILPYINGFGGESDKSIINELQALNIDPNRKVIDLEESENQKIQEKTNANKGHYALLNQKQGILRFAFEHALLLNILCFKNISAAISIIQLKKSTRYAKDLYHEYINNLTKNMKTLSTELPRVETNKAIFIDVMGKIPPSSWSDTASFSSVNELLDPYKILVLGGEEKKSRTIKLSIRCTKKFLADNEGIGVNSIISKIKGEYGGMGGGHKLAGGIRLSKPSYKLLKNKIDDFI